MNTGTVEVGTYARWLIPVNEAHWFLSAAGRKLHFAPEADSNRVYTWGGCGTRVDVGRSKGLRTAVGSLLDHYFPCARCVDHMTDRGYLLDAEMARLRRDTEKLVAAVMSLLDRKAV